MTALLIAIARFTTKERAWAYSLIMAVISLAAFAANLALRDGLLGLSGHAVGTDFLAFYTGGHFLLEERLPELYAYGPQDYFPAQFEFQKSVIGEGYSGHHPFISPPFTALLFAPFAKLGYLSAYGLWMALGIALLTASVLLARRELAALRHYTPAQLLLGCFLFFPTIGWLMYGQATPLILLLYVLTYTALKNDRDVLAGLCLGALAFKPQLAVALVLMLLIKGRWRALLGGALSLGAWLAAGLALSPEAMESYAGIGPTLVHFLRLPDYPTWGVHSLLGFSALLFDGLSKALADGLTAILSLGLLILIGRLWWRQPWKPASRAWDLAFAATLAWGLLLSPQLFLYDLMLLLLPFAIAWNHTEARGDMPLGDPRLLAWTALLWAVTYLGSHLSLGQQTLCELVGLPPVALQLSTLVIFMWGNTILHKAER